MTQKKIISRYCGDGMPERLTSSKDTVLVHFQSDYSVAHNGFRLGKVVLILIIIFATYLINNMYI